MKQIMSNKGFHDLPCNGSIVVQGIIQLKWQLYGSRIYMMLSVIDGVHALVANWDNWDEITADWDDPCHWDEIIPWMEVGCPSGMRLWIN